MKPPSEPKTILLIEDDHGVRAILTIFLERVGFRVLEAASCAEARQIWENESDILDVVVADIVLPDGVGSDLIHQFREERHDLNVVVISGGVPAPSSGFAPDGSVLSFLAKPFTPRALLDAIHAACADNNLLANRMTP